MCNPGMQTYNLYMCIGLDVTAVENMYLDQWKVEKRFVERIVELFYSLDVSSSCHESLVVTNDGIQCAINQWHC